MSIKQIISIMSSSVSNITEDDVLIIAGQSNAVGSTFGVFPPLNVPNVNAQIVGYNSNSSGSSIQEIPTYTLMDYSSNYLGNIHGVEYEVCRLYNSQTLKVVKVTKGGTSLAVSWASGSDLRNRLIANINYAKAQNPNARFIFYWNQWESDSTQSGRSNDYQVNYENFINEVLSSTGVTFDKHFISKVNVNAFNYIDNPVFSETIIAAQISNAATLNGTILDFDSQVIGVDNIHYPSQSQINMGNILFNAL